MTRRSSLCLLASLTSCLVLGCGDSGGVAGDGDSGTGPVVDVTPAVETDVGGDAHPATADVAPDVGPDAWLDLDTAGLASDADTQHSGADAAEVGSQDAPDTHAVAAPDVPPDVPAARERCEPPLTLTPAETWVLPLGLATLGASGGTGAYSFIMMNPDSGGLLNPITGAYLAGTTPWIDDVILLSDAGCEGDASALVHVVGPMVVSPAAPEVEPGTAFELVVTGGSGLYACELLIADSGAVMSDGGPYVAGAEDGTDIIECVDLGTGQATTVVVSVVTGAAPVAAPARLAIPVGSTYLPRVEGGSGVFDWTIEGAAVTFDAEAGVLVAVEAGRATALAEDAFTGQTVELVVDAVEAFQHESVWAGDATLHAPVVTPGDIDGDGYPDVLFGYFEADVLATLGGAIFIYRGGAEGIDPEPARVIAGVDRRDEMGRGLAVGDFDADGLLDLAAAANGRDVGAVDTGEVAVYYGEAGKLFADAPAQTFSAPFAGDRLGFAAAACDFDGDGYDDLAASAWAAENRDLETVPTNQGAIYLFRGGPLGLSYKPDAVLFGQAPDETGAWVDVPSLFLADSLAAGDVDGDGLCDLVAGALRYSSGPGRTNDGLVVVYRGRAGTEATQGGLDAIPAFAWADDIEGDVGAQFGRYVAAGDLDGDGLAEVVASHYAFDAPSEGGINRGAVRVFEGQPVVPDAAPLAALGSAADAAFSSVGDDNYDNYGWAVAVGDLTGDGRADLLVGSINDEIIGWTGNTGVLAVFPGQDGAMPDPSQVILYPGLANSDQFGIGLGVIGDVDGDDLPDLFVMSAQDDTLGFNVGRPYVVHGDPDAGYTALNMSGQGAGAEIGRGVAFADLDDDGLADAVIGGNRVDVDPLGLNVGQVYVHRAVPGGGFELIPSLKLSGFPGHTGSDYTGFDVRSGGDFDGDGVEDLLVVSRYDDRPATLPAEYLTYGDCAGALVNGGAVAVFRGRVGELPENQPAFVWYGPQVSQTLRVAAGGFDINGDGYDDFVAGGLDWDAPGAVNAGGFQLVLGRAMQDPAAVHVICEAEFEHLGLATSDFAMGAAAGLGDLDGDGCDELAVSTYLEDFAASNQGTVRVFFGWGGPGCPAAPSYVVLAPLLANGQSGIAVDGGLDVDGDGLGDLVIGGHRTAVNGNTVGSTWLVPGSYIGSLTREPYVPGVAPALVHPYIPTSATAGVWRVDGDTDDGEFGVAVALVPELSGPGRAGVAVGARFGNHPGVVRAGGVSVFRFVVDPADPVFGLDPAPVASVGGETFRAAGQFGDKLDAALVGGRPTLLVGAWEASANGLDEGAAWAIDLGP